MMRFRLSTMRALAGLALSAAAAGAAEIKINNDWQADFTRYETWSWRKGTPAPNAVADKQLRDAIESTLAARSFSHVEGRGDLVIVYHAAAENRIGVERVPYQQLGMEAEATRVRYLIVGTLLLKMIDASSGKVVWRGEVKDATTSAPTAIERMIENGRAMAMALSQRGYRLPEDFLHLVFPLDEHDERAWGRRLHVPVELGLSPVAAAGRGRFI